MPQLEKALTQKRRPNTAKKKKLKKKKRILAKKHKNGTLCLVSPHNAKSWAKHDIIRDPRIAENIWGVIRRE